MWRMKKRKDDKREELMNWKKEIEGKCEEWGRGRRIKEKSEWMVKGTEGKCEEWSRNGRKKEKNEWIKKGKWEERIKKGGERKKKNEWIN